MNRRKNKIDERVCVHVCHEVYYEEKTFEFELGCVIDRREEKEFTNASQKKERKRKKVMLTPTKQEEFDQSRECASVCVCVLVARNERGQVCVYLCICAG